MSLTMMKKSVSWLDLRGYGLSMLERLVLEEVLLHHDNRNWILIGNHSVAPHRYLKKQQQQQQDPPPCAVVMGIGGKPKQLLDVDKVRRDGIPVLKRFSGGGTVVLDQDSIWTTLIFGREQQKEEEEVSCKGGWMISFYFRCAFV